MVDLGHVVLEGRGRVESFLALALNTPIYGYAYRRAIDGLTRLSRQMGMTGEPPVAAAGQ